MKKGFTLAKGAACIEKQRNRRKRAFTLAEVLITLGIIGVVASLTIPTLIGNSQEKETVARLKKFNSVINQAIERAVLDNGEIDSWGLKPWTSSNPDLSEEEQLAAKAPLQIFVNKIKPYLKIIAECEQDTECSRKASMERHSLDGTHFGSWTPYVFVLADGTHLRTLTVYSSDCSTYRGNGPLAHICGEMFVDVNGTRPPNATGKDVFLFYITRRGLIPMGSKEEADSSSFSFENGCNLNRPTSLNGYGCTAWVMYNENMDYLKCRDLSWDGKTKCSK